MILSFLIEHLYYYCMLPTIEDMLHKLNKARFFTLVEIKHAFYHVKLDNDSSYLTTFATPWGRFTWLRWPPGISTAPEQFQRCLDEKLEVLEGLTPITDDILVYGCGDMDKDAHVDHDANLEKLMECCVTSNIKLNLPMTCLRQKQVKFQGHIFSSEGLKPDPAKISAIINMLAPEDKAGVYRLLGMASYLTKFAPQLSDLTKPLRALLRNDTEFLWDSNLDKAFDSVKKVLTEAPVQSTLMENNKCCYRLMLPRVAWEPAWCKMANQWLMHQEPLLQLNATTHKLRKNCYPLCSAWTGLTHTFMVAMWLSRQTTSH